VKTAFFQITGNSFFHVTFKFKMQVKFGPESG